MIIGRIGGISSDGKSIVYDRDSEDIQEIAIPFLPIGTCIEPDRKGNWHVSFTDETPEQRKRLEQSDKFYYQTKHFLPYEVYQYVVRMFPTNCAERFSQNSYFLCDIRKEGSELPLCAFPFVDKGVILDSFHKRLQEMSYAIRYVLNQNLSQGHTWIPYTELAQRVLDLVRRNGHPLLQGSVSAYLRYFSTLFYYKNNKVALLADYDVEASIYREVVRAVNMPTPFPLFSHIEREELAVGQNRAIQNIITKGGHLSIMTGGPGTGKTTVLRTAVDELMEQYPNICIHLLSPTGKAAKRIKEVMGERDIHISTIHRFLGFGHRLTQRERAIITNTDLVFVDESSMMDLAIFKRLLTLLNMQRTKIVLVGDVDQLPSVGAGNILSDLIRLGVHTEYLTENFRSHGSIIKNAQRINKGNIFLEEDENFRIVEVPDALLNITAGLSDETDIVLTPYRVEEKHGGCIRTGSSTRINRIVQRRKYGDVYGFVVGDSVIMDHTNYKQGYFNGETGYIIAKNPNGDYMVGFGDRELTIKNPSDMSLAYATTIHKSQGSEYPYVGICAPTFESFYTRRMLYTAVTRAQGKVVIWGSRKSIAQIILNNTDEERRTFLSEFPKIA